MRDKLKPAGETRAADVLHRMRADIISCALKPGVKLRFEGLRDLVRDWAAARTAPDGRPVVEQPDVRSLLGQVTATFRVNGGPWRDVPGSVTVPGAPVDLQVLTATPTLVGYDRG